MIDLGIQEIPRDELERKYASPQSGSRFVFVGKTRVHYRISGSGPLLILIHGVNDSLHTWDEWCENLNAHFQILRFDLPGFGFTSMLDAPYSKDSLNRFLDKLLESLSSELSLSNISIAGNSLGGLIGWQYSLHKPELVKNLYLLSPAGIPMSRMPWTMESFVVPVLNKLSQKITPRIAVQKACWDLFTDRSMVTSDLVDRFYDLMVMQGARKQYAQVFKELATEKTNPNEIAKIKARTMVIWGADDKWLPSSQMHRWMELLPSAEYHLYPEGGHMLQLEISYKTSQEALKFLERSPS